jgi:hypothetical protein
MKDQKSLFVVISQDVFPDANGRWPVGLGDLGIKIFRKKKHAKQYVKYMTEQFGETWHILPGKYLRWQVNCTK